MLLDLYIGSYLRAQLFVNSARVFGFNKLVQYRTAKDQFLIKAGRPYFYRYTHIEAPTNPLVLNNTSILIAQSQVMLNNILDRCTLIRQLLKELSPHLRVCCFINDIFILLDSRLVCNVLPVIKLESSQHSRRSIPCQLLGALQFFCAIQLLLYQKNHSNQILLCYRVLQHSLFKGPTRDNKLARLRNITVFSINEMRQALANTQTSCSILLASVKSVVDLALT